MFDDILEALGISGGEALGGAEWLSKHGGAIHGWKPKMCTLMWQV